MNVYLTPFEHVCAKCNSPSSASSLISDDTIVCLRCSEKFPYIYGHCLNAAIQTMGNTTVHCTIRKPMLQDVLPRLVELSYEAYLQKKASGVYMLCDFRIHNKFILNEDNAILHIG
jgi:DNA-directed RNA polymerase subunit RPC12/RpoP